MVPLGLAAANISCFFESANCFGKNILHLHKCNFKNMSLPFDVFILIASILLFFSLLAGKTGYKFGVPTLLIFLFIGIGAGTSGLGIQFSSPSVTQYIGILALNIILFSGGMDTRVNELKPIALQGVLLATIGVILTALFTGLFIYWLTNNISTKRYFFLN